MLIEGKVAVVFGGARGLGKSLVHLLLQNGAKVVFGDILDETGESTALEYQQKYENSVIYRHCDVTSMDQIKDVFVTAKESFGSVEIVANSAGICDEFQWENTVDVNLGGTIRVSTCALEVMTKQNGGAGGVIVHISSVLGLYPARHSPVYGATKAAIINYCRSFAVPEHFALSGVRFNSILPSMMITEINESTLDPKKCFFPENNKQSAKNTIEIGNYHSTDTCARALITIVQDDTLNGAAVAVTPKTDFVVTEPAFTQLDAHYY